jgi:hypothetical protein
MLASVSQWKRFYENDHTVLYCTEDVKQYLLELECLDLWDQVDTEVLSTPDTLPRKWFWTGAKYKVMRMLEAPFVLMDCDFTLLKKCFSPQDFENDLIVSHLEKEEFYYYTWKHQKIFDAVGIQRFPEDPEGKAWNVSFFYIGNESLRKVYLETAWDWMNRIATYDKEQVWWHAGLMLFCEQKLLYDLSTDYRVKQIQNREENVVHLGEEKRSEEMKKTHLPYRRWQIMESITEKTREKIERTLVLNSQRICYSN